MRWDVFCKVVDHHGDVGVGLAPGGRPGGPRRIGPLLPRRSARARLDGAGRRGGCRRRRMVGRCRQQLRRRCRRRNVRLRAAPRLTPRRLPRERPPVWIDVEYLSAEHYVERSHGLPSPQFDGPAAGLRRWFFYPGFTPRTGGLLRESDLVERQRRFDARAWLRCAAPTSERSAASERVVSLFCYENDRLESLLDTLAAEPTLLLAAAGLAAEQVASGTRRQRPTRRAACGRHCRSSPSATTTTCCGRATSTSSAARTRSCARNGPALRSSGRPIARPTAPTNASSRPSSIVTWMARRPPPIRRSGPCSEPGTASRHGRRSLPPPAAWRERCVVWRSTLAEQVDLTSQLLRFAAERR